MVIGWKKKSFIFKILTILHMLECRELINVVYLGFGWHQSLKLWSDNLQIIGIALLTSGEKLQILAIIEARDVSYSTLWF